MAIPKLQAKNLELRWHPKTAGETSWIKVTSANHYRQICDGTFSPWKCFLPAGLRWDLLTLKIFFYRQVCDGIFSPWNCFTCRFAMAPSHLQNFSPAVLGWRLLTCIFTSRFAMAPSHVQNFSPADLSWHLFTCQILLPRDLRWHLLTSIFFSRQIFHMAGAHAKCCKFS